MPPSIWQPCSPTAHTYPDEAFTLTLPEHYLLLLGNLSLAATNTGSDLDTLLQQLDTPPPTPRNIADIPHLSSAIHTAYLTHDGPRSITAALQNPQWAAAIEAELNKHTKYAAWKVVPIPDTVQPHQLIRFHYVLKIKINDTTAATTYKARLVADGSRQDPSTFGPTFATAPDFHDLLVFVSHCVYHQLHMAQTDVVSAFLHSPADRSIYAHFPPGIAKIPGHVLLLLKGINGLKQGSYLWQQYSTKLLLDIGFQHNPHSDNIFINNLPDGCTLPQYRRLHFRIPTCSP
jgi:hypothetical protein